MTEANDKDSSCLTRSYHIPGSSVVYCWQKSSLLPICQLRAAVGMAIFFRYKNHIIEYLLGLVALPDIDF